MSAAPPEPRPLRLTERAVMRVHHGRLLVRDVRHYGSHHRVWWLVPLVVVLLLVAVAVTTTTTALPVAVYTLF